jgi:hypothetical protein
MTLVCPHCTRVNSAHARFCYYDGASLLANATPIETARKTFLAPFVFPSGVTCNNYDEFAEGCQSHWDTAVEMLHEGSLKTFFSGLGRLDLAAAALEAAAFPDRERALDLFLARLPTTRFALPKLDVQPKLINLGTLEIGHASQFELQLENFGDRLIFGSVTTNVPWLVASDANEVKLFQFRDRAVIAIQVKGQHFRAQQKPLEGSIVIESNAGTFRLKVIATVPIKPFPEGVLAGSRSPRDLAEKAKVAPRQAAPLFESGAVAAWYQSNGWIYPVSGASFSGLAAIQQFFEALGMSKPPKVFVTTPHIQLAVAPGVRLACKLEVRTEENRAVYAHAVSPVSWIVVKPGILLGTAVTLPLEITAPPNAGETYRAVVRIFANGAQRFDIPVEVTAEKVAIAERAPPLPVLAASTVSTQAMVTTLADTKISEFPEPRKETRTASATSSKRLAERAYHLLPVALLLLLIAGLIGLDAILDAPKDRQAQVIEEAQEEPSKLRAESVFKVAIQDEPEDDPPLVPVVRFKIDDEPEEVFAKLPPPPVKVEIKDEPGENPQAAIVPVAPNPLVSYAYHSTPRTFGISSTAAAGGTAKQLTYATNGSTNSTMASVAGAKAEFGGSQGQWTRTRQPIDKFAATPGAVQPSHSTWVWNGITFHQILEVVPGQAVTIDNNTRRQLDSVLVRWIMENNSKAARSASMRMQLDTLIGRNDGVPFTIPGRTGLVSTFADFRLAKDVPDFLQALERPNLRDPGTVAHLTLKPGGGIEAPSRVSLTLWPVAGSATLLTYDVPVVHMQNDSAVVMYWPEKSLKAGESRTIGFAYGLGSVSTNDKLGLTLGGSFEPGQNFTVTAYVENPISGQTLRLELPEGLRRAEGAETQKVVAGAGGRNTSVVTWKVLVERTGVFRLKVNSSTGISQAKSIAIAQSAAPTGGKLTLDLQGSFEPGQTFTVFGKVSEPLDGQTLTLHLPAGLQKAEGGDTQRLSGSKDAVVTWKVKVLEPGKYPVRVSSSTGVAQTKTITIVQPGRAEGAFQILLTGEFAPGKAFTVSTKIASPAPDQKLTLVLPAGLEREEGDETRTVVANETIAWKVKVREPGKFLVGVKSTTGVTQRKTVVIEPPGEIPGRFNVEFDGDIRPGKEFYVKAEIKEPAKEQTLTLVLPKGVQLSEGAAMQSVQANAIVWRVRVLESGRLPIRVESSTGHVRTKTITLSETTSTLFGR